MLFYYAQISLSSKSYAFKYNVNCNYNVLFIDTSIANYKEVDLIVGFLPTVVASGDHALISIRIPCVNICMTALQWVPLLHSWQRKLAELIENNEVIQKVKVWCYCRIPSMFLPEMVACQKCNEWYHLDLCVPDSARKLAKWIVITAVSLSVFFSLVYLLMYTNNANFSCSMAIIVIIISNMVIRPAQQTDKWLSQWTKFWIKFLIFHLFIVIIMRHLIQYCKNGPGPNQLIWQV